MKNLVVVLTVLFLQFQSCGDTTRKDVENEQGENSVASSTITVMSYNIKYGSPLGSSNFDLSAIANVINKYKPDVIFLQEVDRNTTRSGNLDQLSVLSEKTGLKSYYYEGAIDYQGGQTGIGILSRYPLTDPQLFKLPRIELGDQYVSYRIMITANIQVKDNKITVANTHLALTEENRDIQVARIKEILGSSEVPVILGGDFNAKPESNNIQSLLDFGFNKTCKTNCYTIPSNDPNRELDYIMYKPAERFKLVSHEVIQDQSSDHLPVISVLEIH